MNVVPLPRHPLRMSLPIAALAMTASAAGVFLPSTYAAEAPAWAAQAVGQDLVNLFLVFPLLVLLGGRARRGSVSAYLLWLGLLGYTVYSYVLYAGYTRFSAWFPVYVAILALSGWTLVAALLPLRPRAVAAAFTSAAAYRLAGAWLAFFGVFYAVVELLTVAAAIGAGVAPDGAVRAGLPTDPVLMLDLAFVLPGMAVCGVLARRGSPSARTLAPAVLAFSVAMGVAVFTMLIVTGLRVPPMPVPVVVGFGVLTAGHAVVLRRLMRSADPAVRMVDVVGRPRDWSAHPGASARAHAR